MAAHVTTSSVQTSSLMLRRILQLDGLTSAFGGLGFILAGTIAPLKSLVGFDGPLPLIIGIGLLLYAGWLFLIARASKVSHGQTLAVIAVNDAWVIGSIAVLALNLAPLTLFGKICIALIAAVVGLFAIAEFYALRKNKVS